MTYLLALVVGYVVGAKTGSKDLDQLGRSLKALCETDEFADVVSAARSHAGATLRELASIVDGERRMAESSEDLVARVRHLVGRD
jgi:uncharacterized protein YuzB (UPF0349 family)